MENRNLPTIKELYDEKEIDALEKQNALNVLLNQNPKQEWVKEHPIVKKARYIPIERVEWLLTRIFIQWRVEVKETQLIGNSVVVTVRLHYLSVTDGNIWLWQDGIGAAPLQTDKDAGAIEFNKLKSDAVMKAAPAAESYAIKDAAEKIGKLFGKDLNRADQIMYDSLLQTFATPEKENLEAMQKIIAALDKYQGKDKATIRQDCIDRQKAGTFTTEFAKKTAVKMGLVYENL